MFTRFSIFLFIFFVASTSLAQDSLISSWSEYMLDADRYDLSNKIFRQYSFQSDSAHLQLRKKLNDSNQDSKQDLECWNQYVDAVLLSKKSHYQESIFILDSCFRKSNSPFLKILALSEKGKIHTIIRELEIGYKNITASISAANTYKFPVLQIKSYVNMAEFKRKVDIAEEGLLYIDSALQISKTYPQVNEVIVEMFDRKSALFSQLNIQDSVPVYSKKALNLALSIGDMHGAAVSHNELGHYYERAYENDSAFFHYNRALDIWGESEAVLYLTGAIVNKASLLIKMERYREAEVILKEAEKKAEELDWIDMKHPVYGILTRLYDALGQTERRWYYNSKHFEAIHLAEAKSNLDKIERLQFSIEQNNKSRQLENKELELTLNEENLNTSKQQRNYTIAFSIILAILLIVTILSLNQSRRARAQLADTNRYLESANKTKDVLLAEIHHRVKNNFQMISSLLRIQAQSIDDRKASQELLEAEGRIHSLSQVHERLYQGESFDRIQLDHLLQDMIIPFLGSTDEDVDKTIDLETPNVDIHIEQAVPLGSIVHELLTNSYKYAWPDNETQKRIQLIFTLEGEELIFLYRDNGIGLPENYSLKDPSSMGSTIIQLSIERQLNGACSFQLGKGADYEFKFKLRYD